MQNRVNLIQKKTGKDKNSKVTLSRLSFVILSFSKKNGCQTSI